MSGNSSPFTNVEEFAKSIKADEFWKVQDIVSESHGRAVLVRVAYDEENAYCHGETVEEDHLVCLDCSLDVQVGSHSEPLAEFEDWSIECPGCEGVEEPTEWFESLSPDVDVGSKERAIKRSVEYDKVDSDKWTVTIGDGDKHLIRVGESGPECSCEYRTYNDSCVHEFGLYYQRLAEKHEERW